jgi:hypothetical protein
MYLIKYNIFQRTLLTFTFLTCQERKSTDGKKEKLLIDLLVHGCEVLLLAKSLGLTRNSNYVQDYVIRYGKIKKTIGRNENFDRRKRKTHSPKFFVNC